MEDTSGEGEQECWFGEGGCLELSEMVMSNIAAKKILQSNTKHFITYTTKQTSEQTNEKDLCLVEVRRDLLLS